VGEIAWLDDAVAKEIDLSRRIMRPGEIRYDLLDPQVRDLVRALNDSGVVETLWSCAGHPLDEDQTLSAACSATVLLHVLDKAGWRQAALAIAQHVRVLAGVAMTVTFEHEAQLRFTVPEWLAPAWRRMLLDAALEAAACALREWSANALAAGD
jgi:hypothetical protein